MKNSIYSADQPFFLKTETDIINIRLNKAFRLFSLCKSRPVRFFKFTVFQREIQFRVESNLTQMCILFLLKREFSTGYNYRVSKIPFSLDFYNVDIQKFIYKPKFKKSYEIEIE